MFVEVVFVFCEKVLVFGVVFFICFLFVVFVVDEVEYDVELVVMC